MKAGNESTPTNGVVDIDSFVTYLKEVYNLTGKETSPDNEARFSSQVYSDDIIGDDSKFLPLIRECPWSIVPESLKEILSIQYESLLISGDKTLDVDYFKDEEGLMFRPTSSEIRALSDVYGEVFTGMGLMLKLTKNNKGKWAIFKLPITFKNKIHVIERLEDDEMRQAEWKDLIQQAQAFIETRESILPELRDLVKFFEESKHYSVAA